MIAIFGAALIFVFGRTVARYWLVRRYQDGKITGRTMLLLIVSITVVPYLALIGYMIVAAPEDWWIAVLLFVASWPVVILPAVAHYYQAKRNRDAA